MDGIPLGLIGIAATAWLLVDQEPRKKEQFDRVFAATAASLALSFMAIFAVSFMMP